MSEADKATYFQPGDWMQYWSTAMQDWQRAYAWAWDGFAQRAEEMTGMRGGPAFSPDDFVRMGARMMENWSAAMKGMPGLGMPGMAMPEGMGLPGASGQQQIAACAKQAYLATLTSLMRWWMRVA